MSEGVVATRAALSTCGMVYDPSADGLIAASVADGAFQTVASREWDVWDSALAGSSSLRAAVMCALNCENAAAHGEDGRADTLSECIWLGTSQSQV